MKFISKVGVNEFKEVVYDKSIYCFGSGVLAQSAINVLLDVGINESIKGFVDNNSSKWGSQFRCGSFVAPIISIEEMFQSPYDKVILITCGDIAGIIEQLNECEELKDVEIYSWPHVLSKDYSGKSVVGKRVKTEKQMIPKKIHYCWFGGKPIPDEFHYFIDGWRKKCPDYEIIRWDETNYDVTKNIYMKQAYDCGKWGFVPDYARLDIIYQEGGIYLDTDVELKKNLDELLYQEAYAGLCMRKYVNLGLGFGAMKRHPFIKELRDYYDDKMFVDQNGNIDLTTCDLHQYNVFKKYGFRLDGSFQKIQGMSLYPVVFFEARNYYTQKESVTEETFSVHHSAGTWFTDTIRKAVEKRSKIFEQL